MTYCTALKFIVYVSRMKILRNSARARARPYYTWPRRAGCHGRQLPRRVRHAARDAARERRAAADLIPVASWSQNGVSRRRLLAERYDSDRCQQRRSRHRSTRSTSPPRPSSLRCFRAKKVFVKQINRGFVCCANWTRCACAC